MGKFCCCWLSKKHHNRTCEAAIGSDNPGSVHVEEPYGSVPVGMVSVSYGHRNHNEKPVSLSTVEQLAIHGHPRSNGNRGDETQHIADRELGDEATDPSMNLDEETYFVKEKRDGQSWYFDLLNRMKHCDRRRPNTTTEIYLDGSVASNPDSRATIRAVAIAICLLIRSNGLHTMRTDEDLEIFDEKFHPLKIEQSPSEDPDQPPSLRTVHRFIRKIFQNAQLSPECAVVTMVYLERLMYGGLARLTVSNWKRVVLCAILLASKVWDDQAVWNVDYCQILDELNVDDVNELERRFLEIIQFNINVKSSVYTKYYFEIRDLTVSSHDFTPLTTQKAKDLEACSHSLLDCNLGPLKASRYRRNRANSQGSCDEKRRVPLFVLP